MPLTALIRVRLPVLGVLVHAGREQFQVLRIHAPRVKARVVNFHIVGDKAFEQPIRHTVSSGVRSLNEPCRSLTVAALSAAELPFPTAVR